MPIEYNGTPVGDVSVNGQAIDEITVNGDVVFSSVKIVDDFDANDLTSRWNTNGHLGTFNGFSTVTSPVQSGSHALKFGGNDGASLYLDASQNQPTPQFGQSQEFYMNPVNFENVYVMWLSDKQESAFNVPRGHWVKTQDSGLSYGMTGADDLNASTDGAGIVPSGYIRCRIDYINSNNDMQLTLFDDNNSQFYQGSVPVVNQGFGSSCALHSTDTGFSRIDSWKIL